MQKTSLSWLNQEIYFVVLSSFKCASIYTSTLMPVPYILVSLSDDIQWSVSYATVLYWILSLYGILLFILCLTPFHVSYHVYVLYNIFVSFQSKKKYSHFLYRIKRILDHASCVCDQYICGPNHTFLLWRFYWPEFLWYLRVYSNKKIKLELHSSCSWDNIFIDISDYWYLHICLLSKAYAWWRKISKKENRIN